MNEVLLKRIHRWRQAYWEAWIFWSGVSFGALAILMVHQLTGGAWGEALRGTAEAAAKTIPLMGVLLIPIFFVLRDLFPWQHPGAPPGQASPHQRAYLTAGWFAVRGLGYFIVLGGWTVVLGLWKSREKRSVRSGAPAIAPSAGGLIVYAGLMLFASTDWIVSLEPQWSSTMMIVIFLIDHFLAALALSIVFASSLSREEADPGSLTIKQAHDLGNVLLAFVMLWAYVTFSQFLIVWSGNLPREISWYLHRASGPWPGVVIALLLLQFAIPFALLLFRAAKRSQRVLRPIAGLVFVASALHTWWLVAPSFQSSGLLPALLLLGTFVGVGGLWVTLFLEFLKRPFDPLSATGREVACA
jgi:hypothetical protein